MDTVVPSVIDHAAHTAYSDPGAHAALLDELPTDPGALGEVARNVIVHYRAFQPQLPEATRGDINTRWLRAILDTDQERHAAPLAEERELATRVQGCCRDHTLLCVGALRQHGIPARSRVGFAGYFTGGFHHDHVIVEAWIDGGWRRFDPEVEAPSPELATPLDMALEAADATGFTTAAQAWVAYRRGEIDASRYGVHPDVPEVGGAGFLYGEVIYEVAHRFGDELLLWDAWGRIAPPDAPVSDEDAALADEIAALLLAADAGDLDAERRLLERYRSDPGLHPGPRILTMDPFGGPPAHVTL
ncbi:transglutaminase-like domain-containing protein [Microbacterium phosphatis]|uniref:transglutaminase-like domain-containing protein n=1 Tax=Microbacterium phosphatis TaxID=3140248 RepID=UPI00314015FE